MYSSDIFSLLCLDSHYKSYCIYHPGPWSCCKKRKWSFCIQSYAELFIEYCVKLQKNKKQQNKTYRYKLCIGFTCVPKLIFPIQQIYRQASKYVIHQQKNIYNMHWTDKRAVERMMYNVFKHIKMLYNSLRITYRTILCCL